MAEAKQQKPDEILKLIRQARKGQRIAKKNKRCWMCFFMELFRRCSKMTIISINLRG
jgi:hypothetical protein